MRTHAILTMVMAGMLAWTAAAAQQPRTDDIPAETPELSKAEKLFNDGRQALLTGDYDKAVKLLGQAVKADDTKTAYRLNLARAYRYAGKTGQARTQLEAILAVSGDHVEAGQLLAEIHAQDKQWKEVVAVLEPLLKYRHDYTTYHLLAQACQNLNDAEKARKYYEQAVKFNPGSAADHYALGNIYLAGNFYALAAEAYQRALTLGVDTPVLRYKLASAQFNLRNYFGRVTVVTVKAGQADTISDDWYLIEPTPGKEDTFHAAPAGCAIYQLAKAVADGLEETPDIRFLKANIYLKARRYRQAYDMFAKLEKEVAKEDKALFHYHYAQSAFGIGKYDEYLAQLNKAIELDKDAYEPTLVEAYLKVADQHNQAGKLDEYIRYLELAVAASPQTAALHLKLGNAYEQARKFDKAVIQWRMVLDLESDHPQRMKLLNLITKYGAR